MNNLYNNKHLSLDDRIKKAITSDLTDFRTPIIYLKAFDRDELIQISEKILEMHSQVYDWDGNEKISPIIEPIVDNHLSDAATLTEGKFTARDFIRRFISLLDTVQQNQLYFNSADEILSEFYDKINLDVDFDDFDDEF